MRANSATSRNASKDRFRRSASRRNLDDIDASTSCKTFTRIEVQSTNTSLGRSQTSEALDIHPEGPEATVDVVSCLRSDRDEDPLSSDLCDSHNDSQNHLRSPPCSRNEDLRRLADVRTSETDASAAVLDQSCPSSGSSPRVRRVQDLVSAMASSMTPCFISIEEEASPDPLWDQDLMSSSTRRSRASGQSAAASAARVSALKDQCWDRASAARIRWPDRVRVFLYLLLDEPGSSRGAQVTSVIILLTIVLSIVCILLETMPELKHVAHSSWAVLEITCTVIFTVEYVLRLLVCDVGGTRTAFLTNPMNCLDLISILPFYIMLLLTTTVDTNALRVVRVVRLIRLFRIFKLARYSSGMRMMGEALAGSVQALWVLVFFLSIGVILFASMMYYVEKMSCPTTYELAQEPGAQQRYVAECSEPDSRGVSASYGLCCDENNSPLDFPSIPAAFWWAIVSMTTVGYGDAYPRTRSGKAVATFCMLSGLLLIALPVAMVGRKFSDIYARHIGEEIRDRSSRKHSLSGAHGEQNDSGRCSRTSRRRRSAEMRAGEAMDAVNDSESEKLTKCFGVQLRRFWVPHNPAGLKLKKAVDDLSHLLEEAEPLHKAVESLQTANLSLQDDIEGKFDELVEAHGFLIPVSAASPSGCSSASGRRASRRSYIRREV